MLAYLMRETADREASADLAAETFAAVMLASRGYRRQGDSAGPVGDLVAGHRTGGPVWTTRFVSSWFSPIR